MTINIRNYPWGYFPNNNNNNKVYKMHSDLGLIIIVKFMHAFSAILIHANLITYAQCMTVYI